MKEKYEKPEVQVIEFEESDVAMLIYASATIPGFGGQTW